jgi:hypothetical protein
VSRRGKETPVDGAPVLCARTATDARAATKTMTVTHSLLGRASWPRFFGLEGRPCIARGEPRFRVERNPRYTRGDKVSGEPTTTRHNSDTLHKSRGPRKIREGLRGRNAILLRDCLADGRGLRAKSAPRRFLDAPCTTLGSELGQVHGGHTGGRIDGRRHGWWLETGD